MPLGHAGFGNPARYDRTAAHLSAKLYAKIIADVSASALPDGARVLDVGTGTGRIPHALAAAHPTWSVEGVDLEPRMIDYARRQDPSGRAIFTVGDVAALPYPDATFDLVVSSMSQHHWHDLDGALRELRRVLRPGGRLWIYDVRFVLHRATRAARNNFASVRREAARTTNRPFPLFARLTAHT